MVSSGGAARRKPATANRVAPRDGWILLQSVSPKGAAIWLADKRDAIGDLEFRALYLEYDAAFDYPRLPALADRARRWLTARDGSSRGAARAVPDPTIARLVATSAGASSPAWDRLAELAGRPGPRV
jgi:hypothetical protein